MNPDVYIFWQREVSDIRPGPWFQCDVQQEPAPHSKQSAARLLEMIRDNEPRPQDWEFMVELRDDAGVSDVTLSIEMAVEQRAAELEIEEVLDTSHIWQETHGFEQC